MKNSSTPPPFIGRAGRYTVFMTPPSTPKPTSHSPTPNIVHSPSPLKSPEMKVVTPPVVSATPMMVQVPPQQFMKPASSAKNVSRFGFFWEAVNKVQTAHSDLDEYLAKLFGLNCSKYQWALNDYYETTGGGKGGPMGFQEKGDAMPKDPSLVGKEQIV